MLKIVFTVSLTVQCSDNLYFLALYRFFLPFFRRFENFNRMYIVKGGKLHVSYH